MLCFFLLSAAFNPLMAQSDAQIRKIEFMGNHNLSSGELLRQMNTQTKTSTQRWLSHWMKWPVYSSNVMNEDLSRLRKYYQRNGFLSPVITSRIIPTEREDRIHILLEIIEGPPVLIKKVEWEGIPAGHLPFMKTINAEIPVRVGERFSDKNLTRSEAIISREFMNNGYPGIQVKHVLSVDFNRQSVSVIWKLSSGKLSYFGDLTLSGNEHIDSAYIFKHVEIVKGNPFSKKEMEETQQELFDLGLFRYLTVKANTNTMIDSLIPVSITLKESPRYNLESGIGYGTDDRLRVSATLTRLHFLGGSRRLLVSVKRSHYFPIGVEARYIQSDLILPNFDLIINPFYLHQLEQSYHVKRLGASATVRHKFNRQSSLNFTYTAENDQLTIIETEDYLEEEELHDKSGITCGYSLNTTSDVFDPHNGWRFDGVMSYMGVGFQSKYHYIRMEVDGRTYVELFDNWVLATRLKMGFIETLRSDVSSPIEDRFLLGGASTLRGWSRNAVSILDEDSLLVGGNYMALANFELRVPVYDIFSGVVFFDSGNIWNSSFAIPVPHLDAGFGFRAKSPIGPIRFDIGFPLNADDFKPQFFVSIGHMF
jgi:outer membrane protein insertion porin family